jgi:23S rRNA pseudouridine1911/1915/1917 synthase
MLRNDGFDFTLVLDRSADGMTAADYLAQRFAHSSREDWEARLEAGCVWVDAAEVHADTVLRAGHTLVWRRPAWVEPEAPLAFDVLYEDAELVAVGKPAGLPTLPGAGYLQATLLHQVRVLFPEAAPVHRLGRHTSGVVLFARTSESKASLSRQFLNREVAKRYRALLSGNPAWDERVVDTPIGPVPHRRLGTVHAASPEGRPAWTRITVIERRTSTALCDVDIATGRPHQIRIHAAAAGHPLEGDPLYPKGGVPDPGATAVPGDGGYYLHAAAIVFAHPVSGSTLEIGCEPPAMLRPR